MQAPTMEEINHTWTTQGGELAYRLSASYELALIPIEFTEIAHYQTLLRAIRSLGEVVEWTAAMLQFGNHHTAPNACVQRPA